jgi:hypothetical protein
MPTPGPARSVPAPQPSPPQQQALERRPITADPLDQQRQLGVEDLVELSGFSVPELALMRADGGVAAGTDNASLLQFLLTARAKRLDPRKRQCYYIKRGGRWTFTTAIDGYAAIADNTGRFGGVDEPLFRGQLEIKDRGGRTLLVPEHAEVTVWKIVGPWEHPQTRPFKGTADWTEFYPGDDDRGLMWRKMPRRMLAKCAHAAALRWAFPEQLGDVELLDEDAQANRVIEVSEQARPAQAANAAEYDRIFKRDELPPPATDRRAELRPLYDRLRQRAINQRLIEPKDAEYDLPADTDEPTLVAAGRKLRALVDADEQNPLISKYQRNRELVARAKELGIEGASPLGLGLADDVVDEANLELADRIERFLFEHDEVERQKAQEGLL